MPEPLTNDVPEALQSGPCTPLDAEGRARAAAIARGLGRLFAQMGFSTVTEMTLANGRRVDLCALDGAGHLMFVEIKSSLADFRADAKWESYEEFCDQLYFAVPVDFPREVLPETTGVILADGYGAEILREAPWLSLPAGRRKAVLLRFAHLAADRLLRLLDPEIG